MLTIATYSCKKRTLFSFEVETNLLTQQLLTSKAFKLAPQLHIEVINGCLVRPRGKTLLVNLGRMKQLVQPFLAKND